MSYKKNKERISKYVISQLPFTLNTIHILQKKKTYYVPFEYYNTVIISINNFYKILTKHLIILNIYVRINLYRLRLSRLAAVYIIRKEKM